MFSSNLESGKKDKEFLATSGIAMICLVLSIIFPVGNGIEGLTRLLFFFLVIPVFFIKFILKKKVSEFGLNLKNRKVGIFWGVLMLVVSLAAIYILIEYTGFIGKYKISPLIVGSFTFFLVNMLIFANLTLFLQEFFFRGFALSFLKKRIGVLSILVQSCVYFIAALIIYGGFSSNLWQIAPPMILSISGGITAYKSNSMVYSWASGLIFLILFSAYAISMVK